MMLAAILALVGASSCSREPNQAPAGPVLQFEAVGASATAQGERLGKVLGCLGCHGKELTGHPWIEDPDLAILFTSNLTRAVPRYSDAQLAHAIRFGARPDGSPLWEMPSHIFTDLSDPDMDALIAWLRTVKPAGRDHPRIAIGPGGRRMIAAGEVRPEPDVVRSNRNKGPAALDGRHDWARYMIRATCTECHGIALEGHKDPTDGPGTPDLIIAGGYSRDEFRHLLRTGKPTGGRTLALMADVAQGRFVHLTDREVDAIYNYLKARAERPQ
jgi:cytochrome c553